MCITLFKIKPSKAFPFVQRYVSDVPWAYRRYESVAPASASPAWVYAPCGYCEDCANSKRYSWAWRLSSDMQYYIQVRGYKMGFITLTYNDESLPRFPAKYGELGGMSCFSKEHTDKLILYLRKTLHRDYKCKEFVYFLASERGSNNTHRPHYHLIIGWDPACGLSSDELHRRIKHYWSEDIVVKHREPWGTYTSVRPALGFVTPKTPQGGERKRDGKKIYPFEVQNLNQCLKAAFYTAKYVTKDMYFMREITDKVSHATLISTDFKQYLPHHRQSKSLGFHSVASLSDAQKIDLLLRGKSLMGMDKFSMPPLYIQNKLLFKPCYMLDRKGERVVLREATQFFKDYFWLIMDKKIQYYTTLFESMKDTQFWLTSGLSDSDSLQAASLVRFNDCRSLFGCSMAEAYVFYYGMKKEFCFKDKKLTCLNRYRHPAIVYSFDMIDDFCYKNIQAFFGRLMEYTKWQRESTHDEQADVVRSYWNQVSA